MDVQPANDPLNPTPPNQDQEGLASKLLSGATTVVRCVAAFFSWIAATIVWAVCLPFSRSSSVSPIFATLNQNTGFAEGRSACTLIACAFLASRDPVTPAMLNRVVHSVKYQESVAIETKQAIMRYSSEGKLPTQELPPCFSPLRALQMDWSTKEGVLQFESVVQTAHLDGGFERALRHFESSSATKALITCNGFSTAMRKESEGGVLGFFDSHGRRDLFPECPQENFTSFYRSKTREDQLSYLSRSFPEEVSRLAQHEMTGNTIQMHYFA